MARSRFLVGRDSRLRGDTLYGKPASSPAFAGPCFSRSRSSPGKAMPAAPRKGGPRRRRAPRRKPASVELLLDVVEPGLEQVVDYLFGIGFLALGVKFGRPHHIHLLLVVVI